MTVNETSGSTDAVDPNSDFLRAEHYRRQLETIAQNATLALFIMDEHQHCTYMNPAAEQLTGYSLDEVHGKPLHDYVHHTHPDGTPYLLADCPIDRAFPENMREQGEEVFVHKDGHFYPVAFTASPILQDGRPVGTIIEAREISEERRARQEAALTVAVGEALTHGGSLREILQRCAEAVVEQLDAAFARIWTLDQAEQMLELQASAGLYTHLDGPHGRVPVGRFKIGLIAEELTPHLSNDVVNDPRVGDHEWARREGMVSFAGYPLLVEGRAVGVLAMFARRPLPERTLGALGAIADGIAVAIDRNRAESDRTRLLRELEVERARLATVFREAPAFIATLRGADHVFEMANPPYYQLVGHREILNRPVAEALPEVVEQGFVDLLDSVYSTGKPFIGTEVPVLLQMEPGQPLQQRFVNFIYQPLQDVDGSVSGILVHGVEVTDFVESRQRVEEQASELEAQTEELHQINEEAAFERARLAAVIEHAPVGILIAEAQTGRIVTGNPRVEEILRHPVLHSEAVEDYGEWVAFHSDGRKVEGHEYPLARVLTTGRAQGPDEYLYQRGDGTRGWIQITGAPIRDDRGEMIAGLVVISDIDAARRAEEERERLVRALDSERSRLLELFEQAPALVAVLRGPDHVFHLANEAYLQLVGRRELIGKPIREAVPEVDGQGYYEMLDDVYNSGQAVVGNEMPAQVDRDGNLVDGFFNFVFQPLRGVDGEVDGIFIHAVDVTDQVRARHEVEAKAEELVRLTQRLEASNRDLDQFAYAASHDLKAPLRGIANLAAWVEEDLGERVTDEAREHLHLLRGRVHRMEGLIDGILEYSRAGRVRDEPQLVDSAALLREVVDLLAVPAGYVVRVPGELPQLITERPPLQQVFMNLLNNSLKYNRTPHPWVEVSAEDRGAFWEFSVADNGPGIASQYHERIFGIFQTLQGRDEVEGTGIGLSLVRKLVDSRGGRIWVESAEGEGATFRFLWPKEAHDVAAE